MQNEEGGLKALLRGKAPITASNAQALAPADDAAPADHAPTANDAAPADDKLEDQPATNEMLC